MIRTGRPTSDVSAGAGPGRRSRQAFTLLELILVLSVLSVFAALSWPRMTNSLRLQSVQGNAEQVRQLLDKARIRALEEGRTLQVRFEPNGRYYVLLPYDAAQPEVATEGVPTQTVTETGTGRRQEPFRAYEISEDCRFYVAPLLSGEPQFAERLGDAWREHLENGFAVRDLSWTRPILYYPDGTATDGTAIVMDENRNYVKLWVRGLTAAVTSEPVAQLREGFGAVPE